jgi:hypothetical protein
MRALMMPKLKRGSAPHLPRPQSRATADSENSRGWSGGTRRNPDDTNSVVFELSTILLAIYNIATCFSPGISLLRPLIADRMNELGSVHTQC